MKAVIQISGQQFLVGEKDIIKINSKIEPKSNIEIKNILLVFDNKKTIIGKPFLKKKIDAKTLKNIQSKKVKVVKYHPKKGYRKNLSHRQMQTIIEIQKI